MDQHRAQSIAKARVILNHSAFRSKSSEEKRRVVQIMLDKGLLPEDLQMLKAELFPQGSQSQTGSNNLLLLDKLVITRILLGLNPRDVLSTCRIDRKYARVCNDPQIFQLLMETHYPDSFLTDNPHQQYVALTAGVETIYYIDYKKGNSIEQSDPVQMEAPGRPEDASSPSWSSSYVAMPQITHFLQTTGFLMLVPLSESEEIRASHRDVLLYERKFSEKGKTQREREAFFKLLDQTFKTFMKEYRSQGLEKVLERYSLQFNSEKGLRDLEQGIQDFLHAGRLYDGLRKNTRNDRFFFDVPGLPIPPGTKAWGLLHLKFPQRELRIFKNKEKLLTYISDGLYEDIILNQFQGALGGGRALVVSQFTPEQIRQMPLFVEWFSKTYPTFGTFNKQGLRNYLSVPNTPYRGGLVSRIGDYYLIEVQF